MHNHTRLMINMKEQHLNHAKIYINSNPNPTQLPYVNFAKFKDSGAVLSY